MASSQPLAVQAGMAALAAGGNAVDAALATAIALTVVEPTANGVGGDAFALVWDGRELHGLNASGRAPAAWTPECFDARDRMPALGWKAVTVPGTPSAWAALSQRFGRLPFASLFRAALDYAHHGFPVSPGVAASWARQAQTLGGRPGFDEHFLPDGAPPAPGGVFRNPALAASLEELAASGCESFYRGALAARIAAAARAGGSLLVAGDLAAHRADWVPPLARDYGGHTVHQLPPNGQGIGVLLALGIYAAAGGRRLDPGSAAATHLAIEAMKLAMNDLGSQVADPAHMGTSADALLAPERLAALAARIRPDAALPLECAPPGPGGTVYLCSADRDGMAVSYIQSNYLGFGSGVVVPGTGIALHNRGLGFSLAAGHPNRVAGGKRPFHTIIPGFLSCEGRPVMAFGVMGGGMQPQGQMQMLLHILDGGRDPQAAIDAPRWYVQPDGSVGVEESFPAELAEALAARGHALRRDVPAWTYGGAQAAWALDGGWLGASDGRKDGLAAAV